MSDEPKPCLATRDKLCALADCREQNEVVLWPPWAEPVICDDGGWLAPERAGVDTRRLLRLPIQWWAKIAPAVPLEPGEGPVQVEIVRADRKVVNDDG